LEVFFFFLNELWLGNHVSHFVFVELFSYEIVEKCFQSVSV